LYGNWYNKVGHHSALFHEEHEQGLDRELNTVTVLFFNSLFYILNMFILLELYIRLKFE